MNTIDVRLAHYQFTIPRDRSVVVLANYRSGSTALCDILHQVTGFPNLDEIFHAREKHSGYQKYARYYSTGNPAIIKIMSDQVPPEQFHAHLFEDNTIIGIYRKDRVEQITSFAVAFTSNIWHNERQNPVQNLKQGFNPGWLKHQAQRSISNFQDYVACRPFMDIEFCYELIQNDLGRSRYDSMPKLPEYTNLLESCRKILKENNMGLVNE
jgi:hypothetical protein